MEYQNWQQPKVVVGPDGLPHCPNCLGEYELCGYHKKQVRMAIGMLKTTMLISGARDLRYIMAARGDFGEEA